MDAPVSAHVRSDDEVRALSATEWQHVLGGVGASAVANPLPDVPLANLEALFEACHNP
jgi:hypothetical protein